MGLGEVKVGGKRSELKPFRTTFVSRKLPAETAQRGCHMGHGLVVQARAALDEQESCAVATFSTESVWLDMATPGIEAFEPLLGLPVYTILRAAIETA